MKLFESYKLSNLELKNRVVMAPMTRSRAVENNTPNDLMATYYGQRSGAGLIITEGTSPSANGLGYPRIPGIYNEAQKEGWKKITKTVHEKGGAIFIQLMHTGRVSAEENLPKGAKIMAPSAITVSGEMYTDSKGPQPHNKPSAMTLDEVEEAVQEYVNASKLAIEAGFDGVEIHGANGYLIEQFLNPLANKREDEYGGSPDNRNKFLFEIAEAIIKAIGKDKVGLRISPYGVFNDMGEFDGIEAQYKKIAEKMSELGIAYVHMVDHSSMGTPEVPQSIKDTVRNSFKGTYILSGGYNTKEKAEADLMANKGDLVAFGRPFISNPDLVERLRIGADLADPDMDTFYTPGKEGYTDYPTM